IEAVAGATLDALTTPAQQNLNEFLNLLRRFSINLDPVKMREVVTDMTRQNSRARNRLQREFVPGADPDAARAISGHVESRASTIAKVSMRPQLDRLLNLGLEDTQKLWYASDDAKLQQLEQTFRATQADPNATPQQKRDARVAYDQYV
ncbi:hypothetical protein V6O07_12835, partial [Arthrospira platensis SPKY2]